MPIFHSSSYKKPRSLRHLLVYLVLMAPILKHSPTHQPSNTVDGLVGSPARSPNYIYRPPAPPIVPPLMHKLKTAAAASNSNGTKVGVSKKVVDLVFSHTDPEDDLGSTSNTTETTPLLFETTTTTVSPHPTLSTTKLSSSNVSAESPKKKFTVVTPAPPSKTKKGSSKNKTKTTKPISSVGAEESEVESKSEELPSLPPAKSEEADEEATKQKAKKVAKGKKPKPSNHLRGGYPGAAASNSRTSHLSATEKSIATMLRCQDLDTKQLIASAVTCKNSRSDKVCAYLFMEVDQHTGRRDVKCNLQGLEDIAESCRRTCGICCEDINYSCEDDNSGLLFAGHRVVQYGIIDCSKQLDKCHINKWFGVLSRFCAGSCGLCSRTSCRDFDNTCRVRKSLCLKEETVDYMRENCARTCGFCLVGDLNDRLEGMPDSSAPTLGGLTPVNRPGKPTTSSNGRLIEGGGRSATSNHKLVSTSSSSPECADRAANCTNNEDLCGSPIYSEYMIKFCTKTCLKCDSERCC